MIAASQGAAAPYGDDPQTRHAERLLRETFECEELQAFFVATGTAANALALGAASTPCNAIFCHERAHVMCDECGAPDMFTGGAKLLGDSGEKGKMSVLSLEARRATLVYTCDSGPWRPRAWDAIPAKLDTKTQTISAELPQDRKVTAYYLMLTDERNFSISTLHEENNQ